MRKVVVTGGNGLLGRFAVEELKHSYKVTVVDRVQPSGSNENGKVDIRDLEKMKEVLAGNDAVIHLAGLDSIAEVSPHAFFDVNTGGTWTLLEAAKSVGISKVIYGSSMSVYGLDHTNPGLPPNYLPVDEDHPIYPSQAYAWSKHFSEVIAKQYAENYDMTIVCLRMSAVIFPKDVEALSNFLGEHDGTWEEVPARIAKEQTSGANYNVPLYRSYIEAADAARSVRLSLESTNKGFQIYNVCADDTLIPNTTLGYVNSILDHLPTLKCSSRYHEDPRAAVFSNRRARMELGWKPRNAWRRISPYR